MMTAMPSPTPEVLTSSSNPRVAAAAALRDRRERERTGLTLVDGAREVRRALDAGVEVVEAFVCEPLLAGADARAALDRLLGRRRRRCTARQRDGSSPSSPSASAPRASWPSSGSRRSSSPTWRCRPTRWSLVIEGVEKPGNLGAVLRSADGAGVDAVIAASPRTDLFNPNAIRASAGTVFAVPIAAASTADVLAWLRDRASGSWRRGSTPNGCTPTPT